MYGERANEVCFACFVCVRAGGHIWVNDPEEIIVSGRYTSVLWIVYAERKRDFL